MAGKNETKIETLYLNFKCHCQRKPGSTKDRGRSFTFIFSQYKSYSKRLKTMVFVEVGVRFSLRYHQIMILASQAV